MQVQLQALSGGGHNPFVLSNGVLIPSPITDSGSTLLFEFDATNYNSVNIRYGTSAKTINVSNLSGTVYLCLYSYVSSATTSTSLSAYISTAPENFADNAVRDEILLPNVAYSANTVSQITIE